MARRYCPCAISYTMIASGRLGFPIRSPSQREVKRLRPGGDAMPNGQGPTTTRRRLRAELRRLRLARDLSVETVTARVEWSTSKLIRIEGGQVGISVSDLNALLNEYGVTDKAQIEQLRVLARASRQRTWWSEYQRYLALPYQEFIGAESDAARIWHYHPT